MNRWEWLEGVQAESAARAIVRELGKVLAEELANWPPRVDWGDEGTRHKFAELMEPGSGLPAIIALDEALKRVGWELGRDFDAIDHYERNHKLEEACPVPRDRLACTFLQAFILEAFFDLMDRTEGRVKRRDLIEGLEETGKRLRYAWQGKN